MKHIEAQARWKNNPVTLSSWSDMRPTFHLDSPRTREQPERERDKERRGGGESVPLHSPLSIFVSSFCARSTHTLTAQWISNLALISCAPDETNTDSLFTFVKAPAAAVLVPHTPCVHTNTHSHTQPLNLRPSPSWGLQEKPTLHKMAQAALSYTLPCSPAIFA